MSLRRGTLRRLGMSLPRARSALHPMVTLKDWQSVELRNCRAMRFRQRMNSALRRPP